MQRTLPGKLAYELAMIFARKGSLVRFQSAAMDKKLTANEKQGIDEISRILFDAAERLQAIR
jgi:hypothetical protein